MPSIGKTGQPALLPDDANDLKVTSEIGENTDTLARYRPNPIGFCQSRHLPGSDAF